VGKNPTLRRFATDSIYAPADEQFRQGQNHMFLPLLGSPKSVFHFQRLASIGADGFFPHSFLFHAPLDSVPLTELHIPRPDVPRDKLHPKRLKYEVRPFPWSPRCLSRLWETVNPKIKKKRALGMVSPLLHLCKSVSLYGLSFSPLPLSPPASRVGQNLAPSVPGFLSLLVRSLANHWMK